MNEDTIGRRFRLLHPALVSMQETNTQLVCRNLEYIRQNADLTRRITLMEEQRRTAQYRLGDCLNFLRDLRTTLRESGALAPEANNGLARALDRSIQLFLESR